MNIDIFGTAAEIRPSITSPILIEALDYWESLEREGKFPARSAIDPMSISKLLPTIFLADAEENGGFRYRLAGSMIEDRYQKGALAGKTPEEFMGEGAEKVLGPYRRVRDEGLLFYREANLSWLMASERYVQYKVILLPLSDDGETVNKIFGVQDFVRG